MDTYSFNGEMSKSQETSKEMKALFLDGEISTMIHYLTHAVDGINDMIDDNS